MSCMLRALILTLLLLLVSLVLQVARCLSEIKNITETVEEVGRLGFGEDVRDYAVDEEFSPAPGVNTDHVFPNNSARLITAGTENELLVVVKNDGEATLNVFAIKASVHLPQDHPILVQNIPMQAGTFDLVCTIIYEIDQSPYQSIFYNGTIEVIKAVGSMLSIKSVFLLTFGVALLIFAPVWIFGRVQNLLKKSKRAVRWKLELEPRMPQWMGGCRELHILNRCRANQRTKLQHWIIMKKTLDLIRYWRYKNPVVEVACELTSENRSSILCSI